MTPWSEATGSVFPDFEPYGVRCPKGFCDDRRIPVPEGFRLVCRKILTLVLVLACISVAISESARSETELASDFTLTDIDGHPFTLSDHRGKVVLIDFTTTFNPHNEQMHENLRTVRGSFSEEELAIISIFIHESDTVEGIAEIRSSYGGAWTYAKDTQDVWASYATSGTPTEYIIDVNGYIYTSHLGVTSAGSLEEDVESAKTGYVPPEIPITLIVIVVLIVAVIVIAVPIAVLRNRGRQR